MMMVMVMNFNLTNYFGGSFFNACEIIGDYELGYLLGFGCLHSAIGV